jgi:hypothetical protein
MAAPGLVAVTAIACGLGFAEAAVMPSLLTGYLAASENDVYDLSG